MNQERSVAIVHPWFPHYRAPFFTELLRLAESENIRVDIYYGKTPPEWSSRAGSISANYATELPTRFFPLFGKTLVYKSLRQLRKGGAYDLVIVEHAVRNLETYLLLLKRRSQPVAFWGHGRTYSSHTSRVQESLKGYLARRGTWFFAYTASGARAVIASGVDRRRVTNVQNSTAPLGALTSLPQCTPTDLALPRQKGDPRNHTALYLGGLDGPKRIDFLISAARLAHSLDERFKLIIAGDGTRRPEVQAAAVKFPWLEYAGRVVGEDKSLLLSSAVVLAIPGSVGLVAIDSFVSGTPIVTTTWPLHGPEFDYLTDGVNSVITDDVLMEYARRLVQVLDDQPLLERLRLGCLIAASKYTVANMAERFMGGVLGALASFPP